jgi:hypothetical protein
LPSSRTRSVRLTATGFQRAYELQGLELHLYRGLSGVYRRVRSRAHVLVVVHAHARLPAQPVAAKRTRTSSIQGYGTTGLGTTLVQRPFRRVQACTLTGSRSRCCSCARASPSATRRGACPAAPRTPPWSSISFRARRWPAACTPPPGAHVSDFAAADLKFQQLWFGV